MRVIVFPMVTLLLAALFAFQTEAEVDEAIGAFKKAMASPSPADRSSAVLDLGKVQHARTLAILLPLLKVEGLQRAAAVALAGFAEPAQRKQVKAAFLAALPANPQEPGVTRAILELLPKLDDPTVLPSVYKYLDDPSHYVVQGALSAVKGLPDAKSIEPLLALLEKVERVQKTLSSGKVIAPTPPNSNTTLILEQDKKRASYVETLLPRTQGTLEGLTGQKFATAAEWRTWWAGAKATFKPVK